MAQIGVPISDITTNSWEDATLGDNDGSLFDELDEGSGSADGLAIQITGANEACEFLLTSLTDPGDNTNHVVTVSARSDAGGGAPERLDVELYQGGTQISASTNNAVNRGTYATITLNVAEAEAANITNYADLRVRLTSGSLGGSEIINVDWVELSIPDALVVIQPFVDAVVPAILPPSMVAY